MGQMFSSPAPPRLPPLMADLPVEDSMLIGTWHVRATTHPMWLAGDKRKPTLTYNAFHVDANGILTCDDTVEYVDSRGSTHQILGKDTRDATVGSRFMWRGKGWLVLFSSKWDVAWIEGDFAVITSEATAVTPAGMDVLQRKNSDAPPMTKERFNEIMSIVKQDPVVMTYAEKVVLL